MRVQGAAFHVVVPDNGQAVVTSQHSTQSYARTSYQLRARAGTITTKHGKTQTPTSLLPTSRGAIFYLTPDMFHSQNEGEGVAKSRYGLLHAAGAKVSIPQLMNHSGFSSKKRPRDSDDTDLGEKIGLSSSAENVVSDVTCIDARSKLGHYPFPLVVATARGCLLPDSNCDNVRKRSNEKAMSILTPSGSVYITPEEYIDLVESLGADLYAALAEEVPSSKKALEASVDLSLSWLKTIAKEHENRKWPEDRLLMGVVIGGDNERDRRRCAKGVNDTDGIQGIVVGGIGVHVETVTDVKNVIKWSLEGTKETYLRAAWGLRGPEEILDAINLGIDIFDGTYPLMMTQQDKALCIPIWNKASENDKENLEWQINLDLSLKKYSRDAEPIVKGCQCYTCTRHSRAYIHHLINCREMLSQTLLMIHNTHQVSLFFEDIRESIMDGRFENYHEWFLSLKTVDDKDFQT